jgi:NitT/TauT family transport system permease protein
MGSNVYLRWISRLGSLVFVLYMWQSIVSYLEIKSYIVPLPTEVLDRLITGFEKGYLFKHTYATAQEIVVGYIAGVSLGLILGIVISQYKFVDQLVYPYIVAFNSVPRIAISPLIVIWFGTGLQSKAIIAALVSFFPLLISVIVGLKAVDVEQLQLMRSLKARKWQTFRTVIFPNALPSIFGGLEIAIVLAVVGAIVGEFMGASQGLGYYILFANSRFDTAGMFAAFFILGVLGMILNLSVKLVAKRVVFWRGIDVITGG